MTDDCLSPMSKMSVISTLLFLLSIVACESRNDSVEEVNAVYYWRTELRLDSVERAFLEQYNINKVYCRYFDVVMTSARPHGETASDSSEGVMACPDSAGATPMPNATLRFTDTLPAGIKVIPTVFITEDCMHQRHEGLAARVVNRMMQMSETNDIDGVGEIQIDCDYTARSRKTYYAFLDEVRELLKTQGIGLSVTIRLHQLQMEPPPADYGVLMLYNTGDPRRFMERNPVLDLHDVQPYLRHLGGYSLPLAAAFPVYLWRRSIHGVNIEHEVPAEEILRVKKAVEKERPELNQCIVTYHLDKDNIQRYNPKDYEAIYHH